MFKESAEVCLTKNVQEEEVARKMVPVRMDEKNSKHQKRQKELYGKTDTNTHRDTQHTQGDESENTLILVLSVQHQKLQSSHQL